MTEIHATGPSTAAAGAVLTIDLGAIRANYRLLKEKVGGKPVAGVVKADGYGVGAVEVAKALMREGCDVFFVAQLAEAAALRAGIGREPAIYILNGIPPGAEAEAIAAGVTPVLNSIEQIYAWRHAARGAGRRLPAALQVDSGMSRFGLSPASVEWLASAPGAFDDIEIALVMSHLACADEPGNPANEAQLKQFGRLRALLPAAPASLANSPGIFLGQAYHFDLVRPGAALHGINPRPGQPNPLRQPIRLQAKIVQMRDILPGDGVGYGHAFHADKPMRIATISVGYGDGWPRRVVAASWVDQVQLAFIGRVSMDSIVLDISALQDGLAVGDLVELIGPHQTVDDIAELAGTIGYEILTSLGRRFHRVYIDETPADRR